MKRIKQAEARLPLLRSQLKSLESQIDHLGIIERKKAQIIIQMIKRDIEGISDMSTKYHLDSGPLLCKYTESKPATRRGLDMLGKKGFCTKGDKKNIIYHRYRSIVDPDYACVDGDIVNSENYCYRCRCFRITPDKEGIMICPKCGNRVIVTPEYTAGHEAKSNGYQKFSHFCNWIDKIQGREKASIPDPVIEGVKREIKRERKEKGQLTERDIIRYLKKQKYPWYYHHSTKILWIVTGIQPLQLTSEMEAHLQDLFQAIQEPFETFKGKRHNLTSYAYILYKHCQLSGYTEFLPKLQLYKDEALIYKDDCTWKRICEYTGWKFMKTNHY